ncbi:MAG: SGNH/GDSL hydrolase family protein [Clostridiales bacterium]|nr:SGNH/GDSL hydrolase family protein [Clostridiales bacterium]
MKEYKGKYFSVLGDSISSLYGYTPFGYDSYYKFEVCLTSGVKEYGDTWWGQVIEALGGRLLVNNSWSGTLVTKHPECRIESYACSDERTAGLGENGVSPDVIMIYMGTNDAGWSVPVSGADGDISCFESAYAAMLAKVKRNYPEAEIWCFTLCKKKGYDCGYMGEYCAVICSLAKACGCRVIELYGQPRCYETFDGIHPDAAGMKTIAEVVLDQIKIGS